jgi:hypothetical protein
MEILHRAQSIYSGEYFVSTDIKFEQDLMYLRVNGKWRECDKSTRAIHFENMIDSQGNKIFAAVNKDFKNGDRLIENGRYEDAFNVVYEPYFDSNSFSIKDLPLSSDMTYKLNRYKIIGVQK